MDRIDKLEQIDAVAQSHIEFQAFSGALSSMGR
jgi:hypothetical protein